MNTSILMTAMAFFAAFLLVSCSEEKAVAKDEQGIALGAWHAELMTPGGPLAFEMKFTPDKDQLRAFIGNGSEVIEIPQVALIGDKIILSIDHYDSTLEAEISQGGTELTGTWKKRRGPDSWGILPFKATSGFQSLYPQALSKPGKVSDFEGRWRVRFASDKEDAVAVFGHRPTHANWDGTFLTTTGDYRYLAGGVEGNRLRLSCFDGAHAFLFDAKVQNDGTLKGDFWNWNTWHDTWTAARDEEAELPDGFKQTKWNGDKSLATMEFPDLDGNKQKLSDLLKGGKVKLLQIFGSWCPNCHDATNFLVELNKYYADRGLKICGVAFELSGDFERDAEQVRKYEALHGSDWPMLIGGTADKKVATKAFGGVDFIRSYPTMVFFDADNQVRAVYSGFSGPATGAAHVELKSRIYKVIEEILDGQ